MKTFTWEMACQRRLARQYLLTPAPAPQLADVVRALGGIQAQILSAAELAIGARVADVTRRDVAAALWEHHTLVKTYGPRGTLHLLPADDLPLWMAALRAAEALGETPWYRRAGLEPLQAAELLAAIADALDGRRLTRKELAAAVSQRVGAWAHERLLSAWGELLVPAALAGKLCFGPGAGSQVTFVRADQWIGHWQAHDPRAALVEVCRRYIATYGPVTRQDVAHWFRLKPDQAQELIAAPVNDLEAVDFMGRSAWMLRGDTQEDVAPFAGSLRLLPQYDCYLLGCGPRERIVPEIARPRVNTYGRGRFESATALSVLLADGVVAGIWERSIRAKSAGLQVEPFITLSGHQRQQIAVEASRIAAFLGVDVNVSFGVLGA